MSGHTCIRRFVLNAALAAVCVAVAAPDPASAQDWPSRNITVSIAP